MFPDLIFRTEHNATWNRTVKVSVLGIAPNHRSRMNHISRPHAHVTGYDNMGSDFTVLPNVSASLNHSIGPHPDIRT
jgi:hypothetical protein